MLLKGSNEEGAVLRKGAAVGIGSFLGGMLLGGLIGALVGGTLVHIAHFKMEHGCPWCDEDMEESCECEEDEEEEK